MEQDGGGFKVGDLARASGLTIRTVRYYDQIGLLHPSRRTSGGHRVYADADVRRLYRICLLRQVGMPLEEIGRALDDPGWDLENALRRHLGLMEHRLAVSARLRQRLTGMVTSLGNDAPPTTAELFETMEEMVMLDSTVQRRISILVYEDIPAAYAYCVRVFALGEGRLDRDDEGNCVHGELQAGDGVIWLHPVSPRFGLASPKSLNASTGMTAVMVDDVDQHHARAVEEGADVVYPPTDMPYGVREYSARDPEGALWSFMTPQD
jgi:MerR family transcriptional regulator, thiopeptide resistance regulator